MFLNSKAIFVNESKKKLKRFESWLENVTKEERIKKARKKQRKQEEG